jgi:formylglycine-generating enzyme required for sulfatase activity
MRQKYSFSYDHFSVDAEGSIKTKQNSFNECLVEFVGSEIFMIMAKIKSGICTIGSSSEELDPSESGRPVRQINMPTFFMSKYPITQLQWKIIMGNSPSYYQGDLLPVEQVSWFDAVNFCLNLSERTGSYYRLPSEAEWEYACRAGTNSPFNCGENITTKMVNYNGRFPYGKVAKSESLDRTNNVGSFPPNAWGLHDMHGNVHEWCLDDWHDNYFNAPVDGGAWIDSSSTTPKSYKVIRGGSKGSFARCCRSASRDLHWAGSQARSVGFRVVSVGV